MNIENILYVCAALGVLFLPILLFSLAIVVFLIVGEWKLFVKAGKQGWKSIIPFYNTYVLFTEIAGLHWGFSAAAIAISALSLSSKGMIIFLHLVNCLAAYNLAKKFNKEPVPATIIALFVPVILFAIYGINKEHQYDPEVQVSDVAFFSKI